MTRYFFRTVLISLAAILIASGVMASPKKQSKPEPVPSLVDSTLLRLLNSLFPDSAGYTVAGALDPQRPGKTDTDLLFQTARVVCPDFASLQRAIRTLKDNEELKIKKLRYDLDKPRSGDPAGYRGVIVTFGWQDQEKVAQILTFQELRWLLWAETLLPYDAKSESKSSREYAIAVANYLDTVDHGYTSVDVPRPKTFGLTDKYDLFAPLPDDSIIFPAGMTEISTPFAHGITAFVPTDSSLNQFKLLAPNDTFVDNDPALFQWQCRTFFSDGHKLSDIKELTAKDFAQLDAGDYAFAVGMSGDIHYVKYTQPHGARWSQQLHGLLFPEEPILTAGDFAISRDPMPCITKINIRAHHFSGSGQPPTSLRALSDGYLTTLGHFFQALDRIFVHYHAVQISKY